MNIPLPRFTFLMGPSKSFLEELQKSEPCAQVIDFMDPISQTCKDLGVEGLEIEVEAMIRTQKPDFLGQLHLRDYRLFASELQMIYHGVRTRADVYPFATEYGLRSCVVLRLGELLPHGLERTDVHPILTIWLPPMEATLQLRHLEGELTRQLAPIEQKELSDDEG